MTNGNDPEQVFRDYIDWENGDESKADAVSESLDIYNPGLPDGEVHSRERYAEYLREIESAFPDIEYTIEAVVADGDIVMAEIGIAGTHENEFQGLPPTGRTVELRAMGKWHISDGEVVECHIYYDTSELTEQLGLTFPAVVGQLPKLALGKLRSAV